MFRHALAQSSPEIDTELDMYLTALETSPHNRIRRTAVALRHTQRRQGMRNTIIEGNHNKTWQTPRFVDGVWKLVVFEMKVLELILDCPTRWSSMRNMIERFLYLYPVSLVLYFSCYDTHKRLSRQSAGILLASHRLQATQSHTQTFRS